MLALAVATVLPGAGRHAAAQVRTGTITGTVTLHLPVPRRSAPRYRGQALRPRSVQTVPAVAFIAGAIPGVPARTGGATATLAQKDTAFVPAAMVVQVGTTVRFPNEDTFFHNVFSYSTASRFDLGRYPRGEAKEVRFDEPGVVKVYCEVHEFMRAVVLVTENPFHAVVAEDGTFTISGVPAGTHTVTVWHPDLDEVEVSVVVPEGGTARVRAELR
jgi:plastocyanin